MRLFWIGEAYHVSGGGMASTDRDIFRSNAHEGALVVYSKNLLGREPPVEIPPEDPNPPEELLG